MDYEKCKLFYSRNQRPCNNVSNNDLIARNYSWVMTDDVTECCFEVCSDESCSSNKVNLGIESCQDCNNKPCNVGDRFHYWQLGFNISAIKQLQIFETVQFGKPLDCSIDCSDMDRRLGCKKSP